MSAKQGCQVQLLKKKKQIQVNKNMFQTEQ